MYQRVDGNNWRHIWVVGDLHGCYQTLMAQLRRQRFNPFDDLLISVGDLIDRGPDSLACVKLLEQRWFRAVRGNHEQMALDALENSDMALWRINGGQWLSDVTARQWEQAVASLTVCRNLPLIIEVCCREEIHVVAHADYPAMRYYWQQPVDQQKVLWNRARLSAALRGDKGEGIAGADHFWFGHTPLKQRFDVANLHYIDTGAVFGGELTLIRLQ